MESWEEGQQAVALLVSTQELLGPSSLSSCPCPPFVVIDGTAEGSGVRVQPHLRS